MADPTSPGAHSAATPHLPSFITAPGETDVLMVVMIIILLLSVLGFGLVFLRLHTLPERIAHRGHKLQFEIVAVLGLIALFTHMHIFWVAGLLLALVDLPDFGTPLNRIAGSTEKLAGLKPGEGFMDISPDEMASAAKPAGESSASPSDIDETTRPAAASYAFSTKPDGVPARQKELGHA
jgi:hypothetical protein